MKRYLLLLALTISGCAAMEQQQREQNAAADNAWCAEMGITAEHPRYVECRIVAAQMRQEEHAARQAALSSASAYFMHLNQQQQPQQRLQTTCTQMGAFLHCN